MRQARRVLVVLMVLTLCGCLSLAQSSTSNQNDQQNQKEAKVKAEKGKPPDSNSSQQGSSMVLAANTAMSPESSTPQTTSAAATGTTVTATLSTGGSPFKSRIKWLQPTIHGTTGLFNVFSAEGLRKGEFSLQLGYSNYDRDPGDLDISDFPVTFTLGLGDRVEWALGWNTQRRIEGDDILFYQTSPRGPVRPTRIRNEPLSASPIAYYNGTPFLDVHFGEGMSDLFSSMKLNLMSEHRDQPFGLALRGNIKVPSSRHQESLTGGRTTGEVDGGVELLLSKYAGPATLMFNTGVQFVGDPREVELQNEYRYGAGLAIGTHPVQLIGEVSGTVWFGDKGASFANPRSPVDIVLGLRFLPAKAFSIGAGYRYNARIWRGEAFGGQPTDHSGFVASLAFNRKINRPPTVECTIDVSTIQQRGRATVRAKVTDPDDSNVSITWRTTGGRISATGDTVTFETGDLTETAPGRYTLTAEVSDGTNTATCSADITVEKLKIAPRLTCEPSTQTIRMGDTATITARATDENPGDTLRYTWEVDGTRVSETGTTFVFGSSGRTPGRHTIRVTVTDPDGLTATCEVNVDIQAPPAPAEMVCDLSVSPGSVNAGETVRASVSVRNGSGGNSYSWSLDGRTLSDKSGSDITIDTAGLAPGSHSVSVTVTDSSGKTATCSGSFSIGAAAVAQPEELIWNRDKARLDEIATRLESDPNLIAVITGHATGKTDKLAERNGLRLAQQAKRFIVVDRKHPGLRNRIQVKGGDRRENRQLTIEIRPQ